MTHLADILRRADRRWFAQSALLWGGRGLTGGLGACCALLLTDRLFSIDVPVAVFAVVGVVGATAGVIAAWLKRPDAQALAVLIDHRFDLKDRLATAETLSRRDTANLPGHYHQGFAELVEHDADRVAAETDLRAALPIRLTREWFGVALLGVALSVGGWLLPQFNPLSRDSTQKAQARDAAQQERNEIADAIEVAINNLDDAPPLDAEAQQDLDLLKDLATQLSGEDPAVDAATARDESAAKLDELAEHLTEQARRDEEAEAELSRRFSSLDAPADEATATKELVDALKDGQWEQAAQTLEDALDQAESLTEVDRQTLADDLRRLGDQVESEGAAADPAANERREQLEQTLRDQGLTPESINDLMDDGAQDSEPQQQLEEQSIDEEIARRLAREIEQLREQGQIDEQVKRDAEELADALRESADRVDPPPPSIPPEESQETPPPPDDVSEHGAQDRPTAAQEPDEAVGDQPDAGESRDTPEQPDGSSAPEQQPGGGNPSEEERAPADEQSGAEREPQQQPGQGTETTEQPTPREGAPEQGGEQAERADGESADGQPTPQQTPAPSPSPGAPPQPVQDPAGSEQPTPSETGQPTPEESPAGDQPSPNQPDAESQPVAEPAGNGASPEEQQREVSSPDAEGEPGQQRDSTGAEDQQERPDQDLSPAERVREFQRRRELAQRMREAGEQARDASRQISRPLADDQQQRWGDSPQSPRERRGIDTPKEDGAGTGPQHVGDTFGDHTSDGQAPLQPATVEDVDIAGEGISDQLVAEWLDDQTVPGEVPGAEQGGTPQQVDHAKALAERAVNDSAVPSRYHPLIRDYFDRLGKTARRASRTPAPEKQGTPEKSSGGGAGESPGSGKEPP